MTTITPKSLRKLAAVHGATGFDGDVRKALNAAADRIEAIEDGLCLILQMKADSGIVEPRTGWTKGYAAACMVAEEIVEPLFARHKEDS